MTWDAGRPEAGARVVVAIVSWNTRDLLDRCLTSLHHHMESGLAQVWVVDNGSSDGSVAMVRERHPMVEVVSSQENLGYGRAINLVASRTSSPWLVISNSDVALRPGALEGLLAAGAQDDRAGALAPRLILPTGETQHSVWAFPTLAATAAQNLGPRLLPRGVAERLAVRGAWNPERPGRVPWAVGAFLLVRREAWDQIGGFDPGQWMSAEDLDLGWRLHRSGWVTRYVPSAVVDHAESAATGEVWGEDLPLHWQRCAYSWMVRTRGRPRTAAVGLVNFLGSGGRYLIFLIRARFRRDAGLRALERWTMVHTYALAPRRTLSRYR